MSETLKDRIINTLIESQNISKKDLDDAIALHNEKKISLDKALIEKGVVKEQDLLMLLVRELNIPFINLSKYKIDPALQSIVPEKIARQYKIVPLSSLDYTLTIAMSDPLNVFIIDDLKNITGKEIDVVMSTNTEIVKAIDNYYGIGKAADVSELSKDIEAGQFEIVEEKDEDDGLDSNVNESERAPIVRMVNRVLKEALNQRASDIHIEPNAEGMRVRFRIDGVLREILEIPKDNQNAVLCRLKIMSHLDITVNQTPQDGRFKMKMGSKEVDFRVSLLPTTFGQKVVMRILDKGNLAVGLDGIGMSENALEKMKEGIKSPFGMILVTGPTGSGKSTTLYSILNELNTVERNIITVEDPVEYLVEGLTQIHARPEIGLTFAEGLKAILRQSPDVVMVGEIRDCETGDIAIKASLTGQLVLSTLHTNDAAGALTRLVDMGIEPFLVASSLVLVSAQRLCRRICTKCKEAVDIPDDIRAKIKFEVPKDAKFHQGKGCEACKHSGYSGRLSVTEVLVVDEQVRLMLLQGKSSEFIKNYARDNCGMDTLYEDALRKCIEGFTSYEEVIRVTADH